MKALRSDVRICPTAMGNSPFGTWDLKTAKAVMDGVAPHNVFFYGAASVYELPWAELTATARCPSLRRMLSTGERWQVYLENESLPSPSPTRPTIRPATSCKSRAWENAEKIATHAWGAADR